MRRRSALEEWEMRRRLAAARVGHLATVDPRGRPHLVPVCFAVDGDTIYSAVDRKPKLRTELQRLKNVRANPVAALLVDRYDEDWRRLWWVRVRGPARVIWEGPERDRALELLAAKYPQYRRDPPGGPVLAVQAEEWRGWSASGA